MPTASCDCTTTCGFCQGFSDLVLRLGQAELDRQHEGREAAGTEEA